VDFFKIEAQIIILSLRFGGLWQYAKLARRSLSNAIRKSFAFMRVWFDMRSLRDESRSPVGILGGVRWRLFQPIFSNSASLITV
jgi:hypothetical protein